MISEREKHTFCARASQTLSDTRYLSRNFERESYLCTLEYHATHILYSFKELYARLRSARVNLSTTIVVEYYCYYYYYFLITFSEVDQLFPGFADFGVLSLKRPMLLSVCGKSESFVHGEKALQSRFCLTRSRYVGREGRGRILSLSAPSSFNI